MYKSPIEMICNDIQTRIVKQQENDVYQAVQQYGITVDKEELLKALRYDREQYTKGYNDGIKEFVEYLKEHSCSYDLDNYHSFNAIDVDYLNDFVEEFLIEG